MINLNGLKMKNPLMVASGTFGLGNDHVELYSAAGAFITKTITLQPRYGNPPPRIIESTAGLINSVGLENPGVDEFIKLMTRIKPGTRFLVSVYGTTNDELEEIIAAIEGNLRVDGFELNLSCPNVKHNQVLPFLDTGYIRSMVRCCRKQTDRFICVKLPPYTCLEYAPICESGGADAVCISNTYPSLAFLDTRQQKFFGGLSGPAIKPMTLYNVHHVSRSVKIPVIASGGVTTAEDAWEMLAAGARAVQIGSAHFIYPDVISRILKGMTR